MLPDLPKFFNPSRVLKAAAAHREVWRRRRAEQRLDQYLEAKGPVAFPPASNTVIGEAMWHNPNHFFRLRLMIEALGRSGGGRLLGIVRSRKHRREQQALERIGFGEFLYLEEDEEYHPHQFMRQADTLLASCTCHADVLALELPEEIPAYIWYDTVLKLARHPQPELSHPLWRQTLAQILSYHAIYQREFSRRDVTHILTSHPWKSEWGALTWMGLRRGIPVEHVTAFCEAIRIRRMTVPQEYARPIEHLSATTFQAIPESTRQQISVWGKQALALRASGQSSDINARSAFDPAHRIDNRTQARQALSGQTEKPVAVVFAHIWYDFPHMFGMKNYTDFRHWIEVTLEAIIPLDQTLWLLKPHPTEEWYGGFRLKQVLENLPPHIRLLPARTDVKTALTAADAMITVHGTGAMEAAAAGVPVILADKSHFTDWDFAHVAQTREAYVDLLGRVATLSPPDQQARDRAAACFACAVAEPPPQGGALAMSCDSSGARLYDEILDRYQTQPDRIEQEITRISAFLAQSEIDSYSAFHLVRAAGGM